MKILDTWLQYGKSLVILVANSYSSSMDFNNCYEQDPVSAYHFVSSEIRPHLEALRCIGRFKSDKYPPGILRDTTDLHTLRCILLAKLLPVEESTRDFTVATLECHDLGEIIYKEMGCDPAVVDVADNPCQEQGNKDAELEHVKTILQDGHLYFYKQYSAASSFMKGQLLDYFPYSPAILAKVIDFADGHLFLHRTLSQWAQTIDFDHPDRLPVDKDLLYGINMRPVYIDRLAGLPVEHRDHDIQVAIRLLLDVGSEVERLWRTAGYVPSILQESFYHRRDTSIVIR